MILLRRLRQRLLLSFRKDGVTLPPATGEASGVAVVPRLRPLPVPFQRYLTINSDCDGSVHDLIDAAIALNTVVREEYGLPVCDSFFGKWLFECGLDGEREPLSNRALAGQFVPGLLFDRCAAWIRGFHRGWFDTTHGWAYNMCVRVAPDLVVKGSGTHVEFTGPPSWEEVAAPRFLTFRCVDGDLHSLGEMILRRGGEVLARWQAPAAQARAIGGGAGGCLALPVVGPPTIAVWSGDKPLVLEVRGAASGAAVRLEDIALVTESRDDIARQLDALSELNIAVANFSSHAGGLVFGVIDGQRKQYPAAAYHSDYPGSPHYCIDLFRASGVESIQTFAETHEYRTRNLEDLAYLRTLADGSPVHDYHRYLYMPRREDGSLDFAAFEIDGELLNPSWADTAAMQIAYGLQQTYGKPWHGAVIYTHLNYASPTHPFMCEGVSARSMCNASLREALGDLARRYFGLAGCIDAADRVFVAPAAMLARMSVVSTLIEEYLEYDEPANTVRIRPTEDPVLGRTVPRREDGFRDLRGLTFYVADSHDARLTVDGETVDALIRNPADHTGRQSVTVVDTSAPVVVLGSVPVPARELLVDTHGLDLEAPATLGEVHRIRLRGPVGRLNVAGPLPALANSHYILVDYEKSSATLRFALELEDVGGQRVGWAENGLKRASHLPRRTAWASVERRVDVMPFWQLCAECGAMAAPVKRLARWRLVLEGGSDDRFVLYSIVLLRDDGKRGGRARCYIGGRLGSVPLTAVVVDVDGSVEQAMLLRGGFYALSRPVPRGAIVRIEGITATGDSISPLGGSLHEVVDDNWEIDFPDI